MTVPDRGFAESAHASVVLRTETVRRILRVVKDGWSVAKTFADVTADAYELVLTERLRDGMRQVVNREEAVDGPDDSVRMSILPGTESRSGPDVVVPDGRTDIPILLQPPFSHEPDAIIECKRVAGSDSSLCRLYVDQGIDRFASGKYASNHATGFMVGYVILGTPAAAADGVNDQLKRRGRSAEQLELSSPCEPWVRKSCHRRPSGGPIRLLHAFLDWSLGGEAGGDLATVPSDPRPGPSPTAGENRANAPAPPPTAPAAGRRGAPRRRTRPARRRRARRRLRSADPARPEACAVHGSRRG